MSTGSVSISHLSTQFVIIPVNAIISGQTHNPTADTVQFAFLANPAASPLNTDWVAGSWDTANNANYPYLAQCLVGPSGTITLGTGAYTIWMKVTDNPETPVFQVGTVTVF
jgi:hypothetical protein